MNQIIMMFMMMLLMRSVHLQYLQIIMLVNREEKREDGECMMMQDDHVGVDESR